MVGSPMVCYEELGVSTGDVGDGKLEELRRVEGKDSEDMGRHHHHDGGLKLEYVVVTVPVL